MGRNMGLEMVIEAWREAVRESDYWDAQCAAWTAACGRGVWRERHPSDVYKLRMRRRWRNHVKVSAGYLRHALALHEAEGRA